MKEEIQLTPKDKRTLLILDEDALYDLEKIALQFMLGSDYIRESLGALRVLCGIKNPTCFFEKE